LNTSEAVTPGARGSKLLDALAPRLPSTNTGEQTGGSNACAFKICAFKICAFKICAFKIWAFKIRAFAGSPLPAASRSP
jgi:hypothetical protein